MRNGAPIQPRRFWTAPWSTPSPPSNPPCVISNPELNLLTPIRLLQDFSLESALAAELLPHRSGRFREEARRRCTNRKTVRSEGFPGRTQTPPAAREARRAGL